MTNRLIILILVIVLGGCQRGLMPTPNLYLEAENDPFADVPEALRTPTVDVMYVTDRAPEEDDDGNLTYGYGRSRSIAVGSCIVQLGPDDLTWDELVTASRTKSRSRKLVPKVVSLVELTRAPDTPWQYEIEGDYVRDDPVTLARHQATLAEFHEELSRRLALTPRKEALVFIHGFNNTMDDAALVLAELWHFLGREGVPILYTWPAGAPGPLRGYNRDRESGEFTVHHLKQCFEALATHPELEKIHVISHSRGTDVFSSAMREFVIAVRAAGGTLSTPKAGNVVIVAADLDFDVVLQRLAAERTFRFVDKLTIYASRDDGALGLSTWLFGSFRRVGRMTYEDLPEQDREQLARARDVDFIDASVKSTGSFGHGYFHESPSVSSDLILLLRYDRLPGAEHGRPLVEVGPGFWRIDSGYPNTKEP